MAYRDANSLFNFSSIIRQCSCVTGGFDESGAVNQGEMVEMYPWHRSWFWGTIDFQEIFWILKICVCVFTFV